MAERHDQRIMSTIVELVESSPPAPSFNEIETRRLGPVRPLDTEESQRDHTPLLVVGLASAVVAIVALVAALASTRQPAGQDPSSIPTQTSIVTMTKAAASQRNDALQQFVEAWAEDRGPVGVSAAVLYPGDDLWLGTAGLADRESGTPIESSDRFETGSITKTFVAALALRLAEEGAIDLDAPIAAHLPEFPAADSMTVRQLLGHRAGVFDPTSELVTDRDGPPDPYRVFTPDELLAAAASRSPVFLPGSAHSYSNANYWVVGAVLEAATGSPMARLLDAYIFDPLGLDDTLFYDDSLPSTAVVNAYKDLDMDGTPDPMGTAPLPGFVTPAWTAGAVISTAEDLTTFLSSLFAGDLITPDSLKTMLDTGSGGKLYALGIYQYSFRWGHDGGIEGYLSAVFHDPDTGITVAVLTNRFGPDAPQADALARRLGDLANDLAS